MTPIVETPYHVSSTFKTLVRSLPLGSNRVLPVGVEAKKTGLFYGYIIVIAGFVLMAIGFGLSQSFGVFLKPMSADFGWSRAMTSGAFSVSMFMLGFLFIVSGRLTDRFGPRPVVTVCSICFGLGYWLLSRVTSLWHFYIIYGLMVSIGMSGTFVPLTTTVTRWFVKRRGLMTGLLLSGVGAGAVFAPPVLNWLISVYGWRTAFVIVGGSSLVIMVAASQFLKRDPSVMGELPYGENATREKKQIDTSGLGLREAYRTWQFSVLFVVFLLFGVGIWAVTAHIVPHATDIGIQPAAAANIMIMLGIGNIIGRVAIGNLADRVGNKRALLVGMGVMLFSLLWLIMARSLWTFYAVAFIFGFSSGGGGVTMSPLTAEHFGLKSYGVNLATINCAWLAGGAVGPVLGGYIFDIVHKYYLSFAIDAALIAVAILMTAILRVRQPTALTRQDS